jgi:hypothetical protein
MLRWHFQHQHKYGPALPRVHQTLSFLFTHCTSRLLQRTTSSATAELSPEILALMEFTRQQMQSRKPKPKLIAAPNLR